MAFIPIKKYVEDKNKNTAEYTVNSIRKLILRHWDQGVQWIKTPANKVMVDPSAIKAWEMSGN